MDSIIKFEKFNNFEKNKKKTQIIICHTFRPINHYLNSLKYRKNGNYDRIPNFVIGQDGKIIKLIPEDGYTNCLNNEISSKNSIIICLENLGWLNKIPISDKYKNWIGDQYTGEVFIKKWRDKLYWAKYTEPQMESLIDLSKKLLKKFSINKTFIGHNTKVDGVKIFNGIVCKSNYDNKFTDLSPAFDFEKFKKSIENE
jgi:hypothetical protein